MNNYKILELSNQSYDFLVIATSYLNPLNDMDEIGEYLQVPEANLLFDLTLLNGAKQNRYIQCKYKKNCNHLQSCTIVEDVGDEIEEISRNFLMNNYNYVKDSAIPESLKFLLKDGMI